MESESKPEQALWLETANKKWKEMDWGERQFWLAQIADEYGLPKMRFIMTNKHMDFDKIPNDYQKILAQKWGVIE